LPDETPGKQGLTEQADGQPQGFQRGVGQHRSSGKKAGMASVRGALDAAMTRIKSAKAGLVMFP
jgi:hypothetical protein